MEAVQADKGEGDRGHARPAGGVGNLMHTSVLKKEVIEFLNPESNQNFVDATIGEAGHTLSILERIKPRGKVLGIELTPEIYRGLKKLNKGRLILVNDSYVNLKKIIREKGFSSISGILFDLGICSWHLEEGGRGFSFQKDEPLDMRYNKEFSDKTASDIINGWSAADIAGILRNYGQERFAKSIARRITRERKKEYITTTARLVEIIKQGVPPWYRYRKRHFATKTFQALRIAVNKEMKTLEKVLPQAQEVLEEGGRMVIISFHSLEDRIVKNYFREKSREGTIKILTKKPIVPSREEIINNPRSRSAKLRAAVKL
jgi:16S rRNA (cytosine1402-N4)-methyltransferase